MQSGQYAVHLLCCNGMFSHDSIHIEMKNTIGMDEWQKANVLLYPNPADEVVHIELPTCTGEVKVNIYDLNGTVVKQVISDIHTMQIPVGDLPSGQYIIQLHNDQTILQKKIVIR